MPAAKVLLPLVVLGLGGWALAFVMSRPSFFRRCVGPATPGTLGAIRAWTCAILFINVVHERLSTISWLPPDLRRPMGVMSLLHALPSGLDGLVGSAAGLRAFQYATAAVLLLGALGWNTRLVVALGTAMTLVLFGILREYSFFWHQNLVALYVLAVLAFTPCGNGWSVDRLIRIARGQAVPPAERATAVYGWSRYACWAAVALPYLAAGLSKLRNVGWSWGAAHNMRRFLYGDTLNSVHFDWDLSLRLAEAPDALFAALGFFGVLGEVLFCLVLVSWTARRLFPLVMAGTHVGIMFLQNILFLDLILLQLIFFDLTPLRAGLGRWLARRRGAVEVLYDGWCPLCRGTARLLGALDVLRRLEFVDFRRVDLEMFNARHGTQVSAETLEREMVVVRAGRAWAGFSGYRILALTLPVFWPLAPWLFVPGVSRLGAAAYRAVASNRLRFLRCDDHCALGPEVEPGAAVADDPASAENGRLHHSAPVAGLIAGLLFCWFFSVEYYPLTAMQMYTEKRRFSGDIYFNKAMARPEAGPPSKRLFRSAVGTLTINARYRPMLSRCFSTPDQVALCTKFLLATGAGYNRTAKPGRRVARFEIERWACNVQDPLNQRLVDRYVLDLPGLNASRRARYSATPAISSKRR